MEIAYAAHTESCTFMLDGDGICRFVAPAPVRGVLPPRASGRSMRGGYVPDHADRCIGAQYVASIDLGAKGGLVDLPRPGAPLLFARIEEDGRIALVRSGPLVRFETMSSGGSGVRPRPGVASRPSAPPLEPRRPNAPPRPERRLEPDEERTSPYRPSQATLAAARVQSAPGLAPRPVSRRATDGGGGAPPPRIPVAPRAPQPVATRNAPRLPVPPRPARVVPPAASSAPTQRRPSVVRMEVSAPRRSTIEPEDDANAVTLRQRRAR